MLAPVKEENEQLTETPSQDAYSSAMMPNIDEGDYEKPQLVADYVNDIYEYLRKLEDQQGIQEGFLQGKEVTGRMRTVLIDWLCRVHIRFHLMPETLFMTVMLIDRYLQAAPRVPKDKLQLVGTTALFIASKYKETYAPEIADLVYITDRSCKDMEDFTKRCAKNNFLSKHEVALLEPSGWICNPSEDWSEVCY